MVQYNKTYAGEAYSLRLNNFKLSIETARQLNLNSPSARFGLTKYSDMSAEEFKNVILMKNPVKTPTEGRQLLEKGPLAPPATYDWRSKQVVTAVKDQGQCGSCWAFSVTENIESIWMLAKKITVSQMQPLAPQQIVDCDRSDGGCNGGDPPTAYQYVINAPGMEPERDYPYRAVNGRCAYNRADVYATITGWRYATESHNEDQMRDNLVNWGPLSICVDAQPWQHYTGGIMTASQCGNNLDHCVLATGYDVSAATPYWIVRNSWGANWGENGYIRLQYGKNTCGLSDEATSSIV